MKNSKVSLLKISTGLREVGDFHEPAVRHSSANMRLRSSGRTFLITATCCWRGRELDLVVPQRFYTYHQSKTGDRHVYACRSRFIPDGIIDSFDCHSWHERVQGSNRAAKKAGAAGLRPQS
jgi:hypothetical protein